jgi:hypothetical protein
MKCEYGCELEAKHQLKNGKWCCCEKFNSCLAFRKKNSLKLKGRPPSFLGKNHSIETINKIKKSKKGTKVSDETRKKLSIIRKGRKMPPFSDEHKRKISEARKGRKFSKRPKQSEFMKYHNPMYYVDMTGENNPNWKGGISKLAYCSGWVHLSREMREYNNKCQNPKCENISFRLTTHHIDYNKENCHPSNLIVLCHICNAKANGNREWHKKFYKEVKEKVNGEVCGS